LDGELPQSTESKAISILKVEFIQGYVLLTLGWLCVRHVRLPVTRGQGFRRPFGEGWTEEHDRLYLEKASRPGSSVGRATDFRDQSPDSGSRINGGLAREEAEPR